LTRSRAAATPPGAAEDLDGAVRRLDPDRWLASRFIADRQARADIVALYAFDAELARIGRLASSPPVAEIRLAWWRDRLEELAAGRRPPAHPILTALFGAMEGRGWTPAALVGVIEARAEALGDPAADAPSALAWADAVGGATTTLAAGVLDPRFSEAPVARVGRAWGLLLLRRSGGAAPALIDPLLERAFADAAATAHRVSREAFPAIASATLIRTALGRKDASTFERRVRLIAAIGLGRI
jgi:phytoene synthase